MEKRYKTFSRVLASALFAVIALAVDYWAMNRSVALGSEKMKLQGLEYLRQRIKGPRISYASDSVIMVDVHYDKVMIPKCRQDTNGNWKEMGPVPVTDREKLLRLLVKLQQFNYRYIMLDVRFEASTCQPEDSALWDAIASMPRIVIARPDSSELLASPNIESKAGAALYRTTVWETDFVKYPLYLDSIPSMALMMYREQTGYSHDVRRWGPLWVDGHRLARRSMIQTWDFTDWQNRFYLGDMLEDLESGEDEDWNGNPSGKYILVGDFEDDKHPTFAGEIPGTLLIFNAYLSLLHQRHLLSPVLIVSLFCVFFLLAWLTLSRNRLFSWLCSFLGYASFLFVVCIVTYLAFNEVYEILVTTLLFYALKKGVEWYDRRQSIYAFLTNKKNSKR